MTPEVIGQRYEALTSQRKTIEQTWQWIERYVVPFRGKFFRPQTSEHEIEWSQRIIFDDTAIDAAKTLAASIHGALTNPSFQFFSLRFRKDELNNEGEAAKWLEECGERVYQALIDSNFGLEINEAYIDLTSFGTACLIEEQEEIDGEFEGLNFQAAPIREAYFEEDHKGQILRFYRLYQWLPLQIVDKFGKENVPDKILTKLEGTGSLDSKIDVIFCIFERDDKKDVDTSQMLSPENRPFGYKWILREGRDEIGEEGGYYEMPAFLPRWLKVSGSRWGHSPAHICLPSIMMLNQLMELFTSSCERGVSPPTITEQRNIVGDLNLDADTITVVRDIDKIKPWEQATRMDMFQFYVEYLSKQIRSCFHVDQLELKESPAMTATEVMARVELMNRLLGPTMGRLQSDLFDPLIQRSFNILMRAGRLEDPPQTVMEANAEMDIEYRGPLARSQKTEEVASMQQFVEGILQMSQVVPDLVDTINWDTYVREAAEMRQLPAGVLRSEQEVEEIRKGKAKVQQQQMQIEQARAGGEAAEQIGKGKQALDEGGVNIEEILGAAGPEQVEQAA